MLHSGGILLQSDLCGHLRGHGGLLGVGGLWGWKHSVGRVYVLDVYVVVH